MKRILLVLSALTFFASSLAAERILGTPGVISDFSKVEEMVRNKKITKEYRQKTLEKNILTAVRFTLLKKYPDYQDRIKDLNFQKVKFEQQKGTFNYYINYNEYYFFYNFAVDPELYVQLPLDDRIYVKTNDMDEDFKSTGTGAPAPASAPAGGAATPKDNPNAPLNTEPKK